MDPLPSLTLAGDDSVVLPSVSFPAGASAKGKGIHQLSV